MIKIGLSLVLYKEPEKSLRLFLQNFKSMFKDFDIKILIFLNSDHDYDFPSDIKIFRSSKNLGYGRGHNHNYNWFKNQGYDKVIISNTDLLIKSDPNKFMSRDKAALVGPLIQNKDGSNQRVTRSLPTLSDKIRSFFSVYPYFLTCNNHSNPFYVPHISGCFFLINVKAYENFNYPWLFDPLFFMYEEDTDLCRRLFGHNKILHDPSLKIFHNYEQGSSYRFNLFLLHFKSIMYYFYKWGVNDYAAKESRNLLNKKNV